VTLAVGSFDPVKTRSRSEGRAREGKKREGKGEERRGKEEKGPPPPSEIPGSAPVAFHFATRCGDTKKREKVCLKIHLFDTCFQNCLNGMRFQKLLRK